MGDIIKVDFKRSQSREEAGVINISRVIETRRKLEAGMILPASDTTETILAEEHASEPIKSIDDINRISRYLIDHERYRDNMLFIVGINFGLRVSDLLQLRFNQLINEDFSFRLTFPVLEKKTSKTRKVAKNRYITINEAVIEAVILYLQHSKCRLDDYMFKSESNRGSNVNRPMSRMSVDRILKEVADTLDIHAKVATHTLRKTFGYHQMVMSGNDPRKLLLLQKIFGHSTSMQTLDYIGITQEEIEDAYLGMNLGSKKCYQRFNAIREDEKITG